MNTSIAQILWKSGYTSYFITTRPCLNELEISIRNSMWELTKGIIAETIENIDVYVRQTVVINVNNLNHE